jgi:hypothetical protein
MGFIERRCRRQRRPWFVDGRRILAGWFLDARLVRVVHRQFVERRSRFVRQHRILRFADLRPEQFVGHWPRLVERGQQRFTRGRVDRWQWRQHVEPVRRQRGRRRVDHRRRELRLVRLVGQRFVIGPRHYVEEVI